MNKAEMTAFDLLNKKRKEIDFDRKYSHASAKTFLDEQIGADTMSFSVENTMKTDAIICIGAVANSQFANSTELLEVVGAQALLSDGKIITGATAEEYVNVVSNDANRSLDEAVRYMANTPTRMTSVSMQSSLIDGTPESKNYTTQMKSVWVSPWKKSSDKYLNLRNTQSNRVNSPEFAEVNFIDQGFPSLISNENFFAFTVKAGTVLTLTFTIGKQYSKAQEFYRAVQMADEVTKSLPKAVLTANNCGC